MNQLHPFQALLPPQRHALHRRALRLTRNQHRAEDLVQETLLKAWANRNRYEPNTELRAWLFTILRNTFLSDIRKHRREVEDVDGAYAARMWEEPRHDHVLALKELIGAMALLPEIQRRPLIMVGANGFSYLEAADACGSAVGTIKSRVSRARSRLNRAFDREPVSPPLPWTSAQAPAILGGRIALPSHRSQGCPGHAQGTQAQVQPQSLPREGR